MNMARSFVKRCWNIPSPGYERPDSGRLYGQSLIFGDFSKAGQFLPVALFTAIDGRFFDLTPNTLQLLGNFGSHVTAKYIHFRQLGGRSGIFMIDRHCSPR